MLRSHHYRTLSTLTAVKGFTLVELLIVVIIVGALAAIALPSYLNQVAKARGSEAKTNLGSINRSQQSYRWENGRFAAQIEDLDIKASSKYYRYSILSANTTDTKAVSISQDSGLKVSSSSVTKNSDLLTQIICESANTQSINTSATAPTGGSGSPLGCPGNYESID